ncbi:MAG: carbohydrate ABC transporter permease [Dorea sp.]|jgi:multiple sugar transport system permease protein|nr:carbohydrate ABC transporter permease [Dorea sp.]
MKRVWKLFKVLMMLVLLYPLVFLFTGSIMGNAEITHYLQGVFGGREQWVSWTLVPQYPTLVSYIELLLDIPEFYVLFWNSLIYVGCIIAGQLIIAVLAAWALTIIRPAVRNVILLVYAVVLLMPFQVRMLPEYLVLKDLGLLDSPVGIILPEVFSTLPVLILYYSFSSQPKTLRESAQIDGASEFQIFYKIGIPVAVPAVVTCVLLALLEYWNMIEQPLLFIKDKSYWPLTLFSPQDSYGLGTAFAMAFVLTIFVLVIFMLLQNYFEEGLSIISKE